ncbi:MAG: hypothetical protein A2X12_02695, partial [Bacteroidetes bacterium GWE2_29_8]
MNLEVSYRKIIGISFPIIIGMLIQNVISVTDTMFLGRVGEVALGASAIGGLMYVVFTMIGLGFSIGIQIMTGRRNGERNFSSIGKIIDHGFLLILFLAFLLYLVFYFYSSLFLNYFISSKEIFESSIAYIEIRSWALFFSFSNYLFNSFYIGITKTKILTLSTLITALVNVFLDYVLIFGNFGFSEMGIAGAALASNISEICTTIFFIVVTFGNKRIVSFFHLIKIKKIDFKLSASIFKLSYPLMIQHFISLGGWFVFFLIVEKISGRALAISNIIRSLYVLMMIPMWGMAISTNTLVSNFIGEKSYDKVIPLIKKITFLCFIITIFTILPIWIFLEPILNIYTENIELVKGTIPVMYVLFFGLILLSVSIILFNGVSGTGNTKMSLIIESSCILIYLAYSYYIALYLNLGVVWAWTSECIYFLSLLIFSIIY